MLGILGIYRTQASTKTPIPHTAMYQPCLAPKLQTAVLLEIYTAADIWSLIKMPQSKEVFACIHTQATAK
jgi:hypothetical protein